MKRNLIQMSRNHYDVLIVGGGIYGACAAWDASLRGLSVALVDKGDFGGSTSSNCFKIVHGGLRYLQHADFRRMRRSIYERMVLLKIAPQFVHPMPFLMPTYGHAKKGKEIMSLALFINDLISFDRNNLKDTEKHISRGRVISKRECLKLVPDIEKEGLTGGAIWHDCQMYNADRFTLSFVLSAAKFGADVANYTEVYGLLHDGNRISGVKARDVITGDELTIRARVVVNTSGPWINHICGLLNGHIQNSKVSFSKAMSLIIKRSITQECALGVSNKNGFKKKDEIINKSSPLIFIVPWRNCTMIGTRHLPYKGSPDDFKVTEKDINDFIEEVNKAYPAADLRREEISYVHGGLLPVTNNNKAAGNFELLKQYHIYDHKNVDGIDGLISIVGVKYTEARSVAERVINLVFRKLEKKSPKSLTSEIPIYGGNIESFNDFLVQETKKKPYSLSANIIQHMIYNYGSEYADVFRYIDEDYIWSQRVTDTSQVIKAEIIHGIREEMAQKLSDIIIRRTELGSAGNPGDACIKTCASIMATEMGWSKERTRKEIEDVMAVYPPRSY